ncbi:MULTISPECIES: hypothetical protein [Mycoplasma]|uniref:Uncharacterized protein n=2 Tax=Mycoplasma TaxID=2093 RepID=A0A6M4JFT5_9MOLU|nr:MULTISPECIES: hypothetical protein [Mycoplasma]MBU4689613.1 hypothetical protein [Mycoplasma zalophidermidis]MBU4690466.1 hypothetical protein [Mycoplasma miroungigenitalium]MBU4691733.1 hypothetical protein [Mycoplasma miroungigenitalium]MBU4693511.1 hypothetical protein [Mycoplasma zalophidermidis]MCR8966529.1 hypothetical protein [Mycoplasma zalophidermidis]
MSDKDKEQESAPAVVGIIKVSDELLDFSSFKKTKKSCEGPKCESKKEGELTPREKAILERKAQAK